MPKIKVGVYVPDGDYCTSDKNQCLFFVGGGSYDSNYCDLYDEEIGLADEDLDDDTDEYDELDGWLPGESADESDSEDGPSKYYAELAKKKVKRLENSIKHLKVSRLEKIIETSEFDYRAESEEHIRKAILCEQEHANLKYHPSFHTLYEALGVIDCEVRELSDAVESLFSHHEAFALAIKNHTENEELIALMQDYRNASLHTVQEAVQVCAMVYKAIIVFGEGADEQAIM